MDIPSNDLTEQSANVPGYGQPASFNRILLVEDNFDVRRLATRVLVRAGYEVDTAEDGQAGWEALLAQSYALLITDNKMPRLSGLKLVKQLRSTQITLP